MATLANFFLRVIHFIYNFVLLVCSCWERLTWRTPLPFTAVRRRIPKHLALLLVVDPRDGREDAERVLMHSVLNAVMWCRVTGIKKLTVYEEHGMLVKCSHIIHEYLSGDQVDEESSGSEMEYPLTPPPSDHSGSRPISPERGIHQDLNTTVIPIVARQMPPKGKMEPGGLEQHFQSVRHSLEPLTLCITSRRSAKPAIAAVACSLSRIHNRNRRKSVRSMQDRIFMLSVDTLDMSLESGDSLSSPDFMILHSLNHHHYIGTPLELHGFPPWHIRLSEIYYNRLHSPLSIFNWAMSPPKYTSLDELDFRRALDQFALAEMRFGK